MIHPTIPFASLLQYHPSSTNPNHIIAVHFIYTKHRQSMLYPRPFYIIYYYVVVPSTKYSILFQVVNITQSQFPLVLFVLFYLYPFSLRYIHIMKIYKLNLFLLSLGLKEDLFGMIGMRCFDVAY